MVMSMLAVVAAESHVLQTLWTWIVQVIFLPVIGVPLAQALFAAFLNVFFGP
jgi:hypothetical protein